MASKINDHVVYFSHLETKSNYWLSNQGWINSMFWLATYCVFGPMCGNVHCYWKMVLLHWLFFLQIFWQLDGYVPFKIASKYFLLEQLLLGWAQRPDTPTSSTAVWFRAHTHSSKIRYLCSWYSWVLQTSFVFFEHFFTNQHDSFFNLLSSFRDSTRTNLFHRQMFMECLMLLYACLTNA